jgi:hypothetical protein
MRMALMSQRMGGIGVHEERCYRYTVLAVRRTSTNGNNGTGRLNTMHLAWFCSSKKYYAHCASGRHTDIGQKSVTEVVE